MEKNSNCQTCGAPLIRDYWDTVEELESGEYLVDAFEAMVCSNRCGYYERINYSIKDEEFEVIAQQGDDRFLLLYPNEQGRILDADHQLILWPPMNVHSLIGRGYWEEYTGNVNVYELLKKATKLGDEKMIYNFRIDRSQRDFLKRELVDNKRIYQGWGQFNLVNDQFVKETRNYYNLRSTRIPNNSSGYVQ
ncbi:hypothetical protein [Bacillus methanolicus]|uniref:hypothetical protein n=1 Tax=Bacillus methanolicus TaxID=1471 RepID=UPI002380805A|nr:hypothetical protein [Bacillus methanolicus]